MPLVGAGDGWNSVSGSMKDGNVQGDTFPLLQLQVATKGATGQLHPHPIVSGTT